RSAEFRDWLTSNYYSEYEAAPSSGAIRAVVRTLEAQARGDSAVQKIGHRVSFEGDPFAPSKVLLDLANLSSEVLEITSQGWNVCENLLRPFRKSHAVLPLPVPQSPSRNSGPLLSELFHLSAAARTGILFWLIASLRPIGPYPILVLRGPAASGKSTLARALRTLIDPSIAPLRRLPRTDRELLHYAHNNWILVFDQVHRIPIKISEALCAVASGEGMETLQADFREPAIAEIARPIILIAPLDQAQPPWTPTRSLANRTLTVDLAPIAEPRAEASFWAEFEALREGWLAVLADG